MPWATTRAFVKVKSSAITPRQPSVPNRIEVIAGEYTRCELFANSRIGLLEEIFPSSVFQPFHDFSDLLRAAARADEQRIGRLDDDEVAHTNRRHEFRRAPQKIAFRVERVTLPGKDILDAFLCQQLVDGSPGANIAPAHFRRNHKHARRSLRARGRLKNGIVHGNILELRIDGAQLALVISGSDEFSESFQRRVCLWQKTFQVLQEGRNPPVKHPGVPVIVSRSKVFLCELQFGFLCESPNGKNGKDRKSTRLNSSH